MSSSMTRTVIVVFPILTWVPSCTPVWVMRWPSTCMPLVEPRSRTSIRTWPGRDQRVPGAVDLQHRAGAAYLGVRGAAGHLGLRAAADPEPAGGEVLGGLEVDLDRPGERVALLLGVLLELVRELLGQRGVVRREPVEVGLRELDVEVVGDQAPVPRDDLRVVVALALEGSGDLDRLHRRS